MKAGQELGSDEEAMGGVSAVLRRNESRLRRTVLSWYSPLF
jgi:hypothetical protein